MEERRQCRRQELARTRPRRASEEDTLMLQRTTERTTGKAATHIGPTCRQTLLRPTNCTARTNAHAVLFPIRGAVSQRLAWAAKAPRVQKYPPIESASAGASAAVTSGGRYKIYGFMVGGRGCRVPATPTTGRMCPDLYRVSTFYRQNATVETRAVAHQFTHLSALHSSVSIRETTSHRIVAAAFIDPTTLFGHADTPFTQLRISTRHTILHPPLPRKGTHHYRQ